MLTGSNSNFFWMLFVQWKSFYLVKKVLHLLLASAYIIHWSFMGESAKIAHFFGKKWIKIRERRQNYVINSLMYLYDTKWVWVECLITGQSFKFIPYLVSVFMAHWIFSKFHFFRDRNLVDVALTISLYLVIS